MLAKLDRRRGLPATLGILLLALLILAGVAFGGGAFAQPAARPDVARIDSNRPQHWIETPALANLQFALASPQTVEWGVQNVNAPAVWALGYTGQGIVVGNQDTGMRWTHAALQPHYRGWN